MEKKNKLSVVGLLGCNAINDVLYLFLNTFMVAYFVTLTNYDYSKISIYYIMSFIFIPLSFLILAPIVKTKNQTIIYRTGILLYCLYVLLIALLKDKIVDYYIYLGILYGIVQGVFWSAGHYLTNHYTKNDANNFVSLKSIISKTLKIFFPLIFGVSIELTSFSNVAKVIIALSFLQLCFSFLVSNCDTTNNKKYNLLKFVKYIKDKEKFKIFYKISFCDGIVTYLLDTIITILIIMTFKRTLSLGILTTIFTICSILSIFVFQRKLKNNPKVLKISTVLLVFSVGFLLFDINKITIVIYNFINSVCLVLLVNNVAQKRYSVVNNDLKVADDYMLEHQVVSELCLNISRILGYSVLFIASLLNSELIFKILLILATLVIVAYTHLMVKLDK